MEEKQKINYQKKLEKMLQEITGKNICENTNAGLLTNGSLVLTKSLKPKLLLHACCGPCSSYVLEYLYKFFDITVFYYNPNIYPRQEYERRFDELKKLYTKFPPAIEGKVNVVEQEYEPQEFYNAVGTQKEPELASEPEKGERCRRCYEFRLRRAFEFAAAHGFDYFCTTLSISPFKDAEKLNIIGEQLEEQAKLKAQHDEAIKIPRWLYSDFKKKGGFKRSLEISEEYGMYRQEYCGCIYSIKTAIMEK